MFFCFQDEEEEIKLEINVLKKVGGLLVSAFIIVVIVVVIDSRRSPKAEPAIIVSAETGVLRK